MNVTSTSLQAAYQSYSVQQSQAQFSISGSYLEITGNQPTTSADKTNISDMAKELLDRAKKLDVFSCIFPNNDVSKQYKSLDDVENDFFGDFNSFASSFGSLFSGLDLGSAGLTMGLNGKGGVNVEGEEGAANKVQSAFNGSSTAVSRFAVMAARAALVDARSSVDGFDSSYSQDPVAAITDNIDALKERLLGFRTVADSSGMSYGFVRQFSASIQYSETSVSWGAAAAAKETEAA